MHSGLFFFFKWHDHILENQIGSNKSGVTIILVKDKLWQLFMPNVYVLEGDANSGLVTAIFY